MGARFETLPPYFAELPNKLLADKLNAEFKSKPAEEQRPMKNVTPTSDFWQNSMHSAYKIEDKKP